MGYFKYLSIESGKRVSGIIEAEDLNDAKTLLLKKEIFVIEVKPFSHHQKKEFLSLSEKINFTKEVSQLLKAGLPLYDALLALEEKYRSHKAHTMILDFCKKVKEGWSFSKILSKYPSTFDVLYCSMVESAEKIGSLEKTLDEICDFLSKKLKLKKQLQQALSYPAFLFSFCIFIFFALLFFVIPSLFELFEGRPLHPLTNIVFSMSHFFCDNKIGLFSFVSGLIFFFIFASIFFKRKIKIFFLKVPFLNDFFIKVALVHFCRSFSALLFGGVPYVAALRLASKVGSHPLLEDILYKISIKVEEGSKFSVELKKYYKIIPPLVGRMVSVAEDSGNLSFMLSHIAQFYESDLERRIASLTSFLQPILLLILGGIIGFVILSILLPLTDVGSFLGG